MKIDIDDIYIDWIKEFNPHITEQEIMEYINEVLYKHRESWAAQFDNEDLKYD